jgi:hypothetical protein
MCSRQFPTDASNVSFGTMAALAWPPTSSITTAVTVRLGCSVSEHECRDNVSHHALALLTRRCRSRAGPSSSRDHKGRGLHTGTVDMSTSLQACGGLSLCAKRSCGCTNTGSQLARAAKQRSQARTMRAPRPRRLCRSRRLWPRPAADGSRRGTYRRRRRTSR